MKTASRAVLAAALALAVMLPAQAQEKLKFKAVGQPLATGLIQKNKEQPFFENFAAKTGLPIDVDYKPIDTLGIKDTEQLRVMKAGLFDIVSLRVSQNSRDEPTLLGLDLVGASPDYATGRKVTKAYFDAVDARLQQQFNVKLLAVWPFGPQILFCKKPITKLADIKGMKVRTYDQNLAKFIELVGGTPVPISFADTTPVAVAGRRRLRDYRAEQCQLGRLARSDNAPAPAGLPDGAERLRHHDEGLEPAQARPADQAEGGLRRPQRRDLEDSEELFQDALNCNAGKDPCTTGKKFKLVNVPVTPADSELIRSAVTKVSYPAWAEVCADPTPGRSAKWNATVAPVLGLK